MLDTANRRPAIRIRDPHVTDRRDRERLSAQCERILDLFTRRGRVSNRELAAIALKYTCRLSDLRDAGYLVVCVEDRAGNGLHWYMLRDLRCDPRPGYTLGARLESRTVVKLKRDRRGRTWVLYRVAGALGIRRTLLSSWRAWASEIPTGRPRRRAKLWKLREARAASQPVPSRRPRSHA